MASVTTIPPEALEWLIGPERASILLVGASGGYASVLARAGHSVTVVDSDPATLTQFSYSFPRVHTVAAKAESLPFDPKIFSAVLAIQNFHTFAPGLALGEWARVLREEGRVGIAYILRDDSVPWVKKLKKIVQARLPEAMISEYGADALSALSHSVYFPQVEKKSYRLWLPSTRTQLQDNARRASGAESLPEPDLSAMLDEIGELYDQYARVPDPLQLPYQILCIRAQVDHSKLTTSLIPGDDGLSISL